MELGRERVQQSWAAAGVSSFMYRDVQVGGCSLVPRLISSYRAEKSLGTRLGWVWVDGCVCVHMHACVSDGDAV